MTNIPLKRLLVLVVVFSSLILFYITEKYIQGKSTFDDAKANIQIGLDANANRDLDGLLKPNIRKKNNVSNTFKPALERPKTYTPNGLGEFGIEVVLENLSKAEKKKEKDSMKKYGINQFLSGKISLHRTLNDPRPFQ